MQSKYQKNQSIFHCDYVCFFILWTIMICFIIKTNNHQPRTLLYHPWRNPLWGPPLGGPILADLGRENSLGGRPLGETILGTLLRPPWPTPLGGIPLRDPLRSSWETLHEWSPTRRTPLRDHRSGKHHIAHLIQNITWKTAFGEPLRGPLRRTRLRGPSLGDPGRRPRKDPLVWVPWRERLAEYPLEGTTCRGPNGKDPLEMTIGGYTLDVDHSIWPLLRRPTSGDLLERTPCGETVEGMPWMEHNEGTIRSGPPGGNPWWETPERNPLVSAQLRGLPAGVNLQGTPWMGPSEGYPLVGTPLNRNPWRGHPSMVTTSGNPLFRTSCIGPLGGDTLKGSHIRGPLDGTSWSGPYAGDPWTGTLVGNPQEWTPWKGPTGWDPWRGPPGGDALVETPCGVSHGLEPCWWPPGGDPLEGTTCMGRLERTRRRGPLKWIPWWSPPLWDSLKGNPQ
jgi:hypothetical protein